MNNAYGERRTLSEWQLAVQEWTSTRAIGPELAWLRVVTRAGDVARSIRLNRLHDLGDGYLLSRPLMSLIRFSVVVGFDLAEALWAKYPAVCPYCIASVPAFGDIAFRPPKRITPGSRGVLELCSCPPPPKRGQFDPDAPWLPSFLARDDLRPRTANEWQAMFSDLYGHRHGKLEDLGYHFIEEIGEVADEIDGGDLRNCAFEAADVMSWILSIANAVGRELRNGVALDAKLRDAFEEL